MRFDMPEYTVRRSKRSRSLRLTVSRQREIMVSAPERYVSDAVIEQFVVKHRRWIEKQLKRMEKYKDMVSLPNGQRDFLEKKLQVLVLLRERVDFFAKLYGVKYGRISVRNQSSIWGSCSRSGNLQFNYKIYYLTSQLRDYIIVHELCHTKEHNHGARFWALVERTFPNHKVFRKQLRKYLLSEG